MAFAIMRPTPHTALGTPVFSIPRYFTSRQSRCRKPEGRCEAWVELAGVLSFSFLPFLTVQAFADSEFGKKVYEELTERKQDLEREEALEEKERAKVREKSVWYGPDRPKWLGPIEYEYPEYLTGEVAGDYGFDLLRLGEDPQDFRKYYELELLHCRWAMLAAVGVFVPDVLQRLHSASFPESIWWKVGGAKLNGEVLNYLGVDGLRIAGSQEVAVIAICQVLLMVGPEYARSCGINALEPVGWYLPGTENYPGSFLFDPLNLHKDPELFEDMKVKEIKNGRLAMVAWLGFYCQALVTRDSPVQNLLDFLQDPSNNIFTRMSFSP